MSEFEHALDKLEFEKIRQRVVRYASCELGRSLLQSLPVSTSLQEIEEIISNVSELKRLYEQISEVPLDGIFPVREALRKAAIEGTVLSSKELWQTLSTLRAARVTRQFLFKHKLLCPRIWAIAVRLYTDNVLEYNLDQAIDEHGNVRANASRELLSIRRAISEKYEQTRKQLQNILRSITDLGYSQDEIITTREGRMVIPVKAEHKNRVHGFVHSASSSGATVFIEPSETLDLNNEIRGLQFQEQREIERILRALTEQVGNLHDALIANLHLLAQLDALSAKAKYSIEVLGVQPKLIESGCLKLVGARHPTLLQTHGREQTIPLDIELGNTYNTLIISGPNAGGKSVAMKCIGLITLMVQTGLHIPASEESVVRIFDNIFVDIGDEQSIENDLSTFSSHLKNLKAISEKADENSLVLIDEIGSRTDPAEGGAIAAALLESLTKRGSCTIATTHHSALKVFAHNTAGVENGAMEFDVETLAPTYKFKAGIPGSSYAIEMAQRLGVEQTILDRSREFMGHQQARLEQLISDLESSTQKHRNELEALRIEKIRLDEMVKMYESKVAAQGAELKDMKRKAFEEARQIVESANAVIERSIREIRERSAEKEAIKQVRYDVNRVREEIQAKSAELEPELDNAEDNVIEVGNAVRVVGGVETGDVVSLSPDGKSAAVIFGNLKMKVAIKDLERARKRQGGDRSRPTREESEKPHDVLRDLDLRGMTSEEALPLVDKFIDTAMLAGLHRVDIIHGKGTGALRKKVSDFLAKHPRVKSYRLGEWNEGGTGATVVELVET
jgi:DNA mismatch repair protein MutS2